MCIVSYAACSLWHQNQTQEYINTYSVTIVISKIGGNLMTQQSYYHEKTGLYSVWHNIILGITSRSHPYVLKGDDNIREELLYLSTL